MKSIHLHHQLAYTCFRLRYNNANKNDSISTMDLFTAGSAFFNYEKDIISPTQKREREEIYLHSSRVAFPFL